MKPRPKPLVGLFLGLLVGLVIVGLLWQLGVAPPDRFILFGVVAVSIALVEVLLTQTTRRGKKRFVTSMIIAGVFAGVGLTGIPEVFMNAGTVSDGCTLEVTSGDQTVSAADTSAFAPLDTTPTGTLEWTSSTDAVLTNWDTALGMYIGGIPVELFTAHRENADNATAWHGSEDVADYLKKLEDQTGLQLRGTYHVYGYVHADEGDCEMAAYIRVNAENPFATPLIIALWVAGALLLVIIAWVTVSVRRSIHDAKAFAKQEALATGAAAATPGTEGDAAPEVAVPDAGSPGAFSSPEPVAKPAVAPEAKPVTTPAEEPAVVEPTVDEPKPTEVMPTVDDNPSPASGAEDEPKAT